MPMINKVLVFDVETSGLIPTDKETPLENKPHILQLSYVVFETKGWSVTKTANYYINVAPEIEITPLITNLTGITREMCNNGVSMEHALREFCADYHRCDMIVAHNIQFDSAMILIELERHAINERVFSAECSKDLYCTMKYGRNICKIERVGKDGKTTYYKSPKLVVVLIGGS